MKMRIDFKKFLNTPIVRTITTLVIFIALTITITLIGIDSIFYDSIEVLKNNLVDIKIANTIKTEKQMKVDIKDDFKGLWKSLNIDYEDRYEVKIDDDSITVYKYIGGDITDRIIYWAGTFDIKEIIDKGVTISKNYKQITDLFLNAAHIPEKEFIYKNGEISFISNIDDEMRTIKFKRFSESIERTRIAKYSSDRKPYFDEKENNQITVGKYTVQYPKYFDYEEEQTLKNLSTPDSIDWMRMNNYVILSPSNEKSYAELFIAEYNNAWLLSNQEIDRFVSLFDETYNDRNNYLIAKNEIETEDYFSNEYVYITKYIDEETGKVTDGMAFDTNIFYKNTNTILQIGVAYGYNDISDYDYLADYREIIKNIKFNN